MTPTLGLHYERTPVPFPDASAPRAVQTPPAHWTMAMRASAAEPVFEREIEPVLAWALGEIASGRLDEAVFDAAQVLRRLARERLIQAEQVVADAGTFNTVGGRLWDVLRSESIWGNKRRLLLLVELVTAFPDAPAAWSVDLVRQFGHIDAVTPLVMSGPALQEGAAAAPAALAQLFLLAMLPPANDWERERQRFLQQALLAIPQAHRVPEYRQALNTFADAAPRATAGRVAHCRYAPVGEFRTCFLALVRDLPEAAADVLDLVPQGTLARLEPHDLHPLLNSTTEAVRLAALRAARAISPDLTA